ncbi:MAG: peptide/nickel transport system substrate-binding protein, partial [Phycisphaerales bacterium]|nr:peptide/nickel transport system substrate-binding protein [Phycisphaerales bacterium]
PPRDPQTLYTALYYNIRSLDPPKITDVPSSLVAGHVYECLYNYDYEKRPFTLVPELAHAMPDLSPDGKTFTVRIKKGIHYFDPNDQIPGWEPVKDAGGKVLGRKGPAVVSGDFIYAWKRLCSFHQASPQYSNIFQGRVEGIDDWWAYTKATPKEKIDWDRPVPGLQTPDEHTLIITLTKPFPQFAYLLAHLPTTPLSRQAVDFHGEKFRNNAIGTGPYTIPAREFRQDERIIMEANPIYRGRPDVDGFANIPEAERMPYIKRIRWDYFQEQMPGWALFQQALKDVSTIPKDAFEVAIDGRTGELRPELKAKDIHLIRDIEPVIFYYGFNMEDKLFRDNKPLRQAISMAFNRQRMIDFMWNGRGVPSQGPVAPEFPLYEATLNNPLAQYNPQRARELLKEAERIHGGPLPELPLLFPGSETFYTQLAEITRQDLGAIGLKVRPDFTTFPRYQEMLESKQAPFFDSGWQADYPDEQTFLLLFYGKNAAPGPNHCNYVNPKYDELYEKAQVMQRTPERDELYRQMIKIVQEDCPAIFIASRVNYTLHYDWISNLKLNEFAHGNRAYWRLDSAERRQYAGTRRR